MGRPGGGPHHGRVDPHPIRDGAVSTAAYLAGVRLKPMDDAMDAVGHAKGAIDKLLAYCQAHDWAGYDPYDALNSRILAALPFLNAALPRLLLTQSLKRSPVNVRPLMLV